VVRELKYKFNIVFFKYKPLFNYLKLFYKILISVLILVYPVLKQELNRRFYRLKDYLKLKIDLKDI
jgi:hypothetical protein